MSCVAISYLVALCGVVSGRSWCACIRIITQILCRYRQYVGPVSYLSLDGATPQGCKRLLVASESGVVAAIDAATGDIGQPIHITPT